MTAPERGGALVLSLDFELHWGVRHRVPASAVRQQLLATRLAIPRLLELFAERRVAATWATVGFLFARSHAELEQYRPAQLPRYLRPELDPYREPVGSDEGADPLHYAASLVEQVASTPGQELGSHTFSHYLCLEAGQSREDFRADLDAACSIAQAHGHRLRSLVFPSNQCNPDYLSALSESGFVAYRGNQPGSLHRPSPKSGQGLARRAARVADAYVPLEAGNLQRWEELVESSGLCNVAASRFLRPFSPSRARLEPLRLKRIVRELETAARTGRLYHLWWHPHNFGSHTEANLSFLGRVLDRFTELREREGFESLSMGEVADRVAGGKR